MSATDDPDRESVPLEPADPAQREPAGPSAPEDPEQKQLLRDMLAELKKLSHVRQFEEFSIWNLFAGLAQVLVFLSLFMSYMSAGETTMSYLTLGVVLQLMALTFFTIGNR